MKPEASNKEKIETPKVCPIHGTSHTLNDCRTFRMKALADRREFLKNNGVCFRCCGEKHMRHDCKERIKCTVCQSRKHPTALHVDNQENTRAPRKYEGERHNAEIDSKCTQVCGKAAVVSKSCSKILLVKVYPDGKRDQARKLYALIDDQSNRSLATSNFFHVFGENGPDNEYILSSCAGKFTTSGRFASNYTVESLDGSCRLKLPTLIECNDIPNNRHEIPFPHIASSYPHLASIAQCIPEIDENSQIDLLIGRDLAAAHHVLDQRVSKEYIPYGQKLRLGWTIIGEVCLGNFHPPEENLNFSVNNTNILSDGRTTFLKPCQNKLQVDSHIFQTIDQDVTNRSFDRR